VSTLILVRHGQASFGASNYDKLSEKGIAQSMALAEYWVRNGLALDAAFSGAQERQNRTMEIVRELCLQEGLPFPEPEIRPAFNEYDADGIMRLFIPRLLDEHPELAELIDRISLQGYGSTEGRKAFQEAFGIVMGHWLTEGDALEGVETWDHFRTRVVKGIEAIRAEYGTGKAVAVFTSGGPVAAVLQYALQISDRLALDLGWVIKNGSLTEFRFTGDRFTLFGFNMTPHYLDESLITYR